jgi:hypothetical protein
MHIELFALATYVAEVFPSFCTVQFEMSKKLINFTELIIFIYSKKLFEQKD